MSNQGPVAIPRLLCALLAWVLVVGAGCDGPRGRHNDFTRFDPVVLPDLEPAQAADSAGEQQRTMGEWLRVTQAHSEMQAAQAAARRQAETDLQDLSKQFEAGPPAFLDAAERALVLHHNADLRTHLRGIAQGPNGRKGPALASLSLVYLGELNYLPAVVRAFERGNKVTRLALLEALTFARWNEGDAATKFRTAASDPAVVARLKAQLDDSDPEILAAAIEACGVLRTPGTSERFLQAALKLPPEEQAAAQTWLVQAPLNAELLRFALSLAPQRVEPGEYWSPQLLVTLVRKASGNVQVQARLEARRLAELVGERPDTCLPARWELLQALSETATADELPWLVQWTDRGPAGVWDAVVRLDGPAGRKRVLAALAGGENRASAVRAAGQAFRGSQDTELMAALVKAANTDHDLLWPVCHALDEIGGPAALARHRRMIRRLDPAQAAPFLQKIDGVDLAALGRRAVELGLMTADELTRALAAAEGQPAEQHAHTGILRLLAAAGRVVSIDVESAQVPCRHDRLLTLFAENSQGQFVPKTPSEDLARHEPSDEEPGEYRLRFVSGVTLYDARLRNLGEWYDLERFVLVVNQALSVGSGRGRFVALATDDEMATYVFGDPERIAAAAKEFHLELEND